jgi:hypothetical protein
LRDGTVVEILGINDDPLAPTKWWTPDGSIIPAPPTYDPGLIRVPMRKDSRQVLVLARFVNVPPDAVRTIELRPRAFGGSTATRDRGSGAGVTHHVTLVAAGQQTADLAIGLGSGSASASRSQVELRNVSLIPGRKTDVKIVEPPPDLLQAANAKP